MNRVEIYWVVGESTDCGKTTISCGLIRYLNSIGKSALGFKPFAGARILQGLDRFKEDLSRHEIVGNDGVRLCAASGLLDSSMYDVANPHFLFFRNNILEPVLSRTGSKCLKNSFYSKLEFFDVCMKNNKIKDALSNFPQLSEASYFHGSVDFEQQAEAAYRLLLERRPHSLVIEGAGPFLPFWRKKSRQQVDHVLVILRGRAFFFENVNMNVVNDGSGLSGIQDLLRSSKIVFQKARSLPVQMVAPSQIDSATDVLVSRLLN